VVQDLIDLIRLRNTHPAFNGRFELLASHEAVLDMRWTAGAASARLRIDLGSGEHLLECTGNPVRLRLL